MCLMCGLYQGFTIRGMCAVCAPGLHQEHAERLQAYGVLSEQFKFETGLDPLQDYQAFDAWLARC